MKHKMKEIIDKWNLIPRDSLILVGLSGGADSVCLFFELLELRQTYEFTLEAIHVEHGIRGESSERDEAFVEALCQKHKVPCKVIKVQALDYAKEHSLGLEEAARILRYEAFQRVVKQKHNEYSSVRVALAHHMDDQAETVLFQLIRGSGVTGMSGMQPIHWDGDGIAYIRPLLGCSRMEIEEQLKARGQSYCTDESNQDNAYSRNYLRNEILPRLQEINSQAVAHIAQTAERMSETAAYLKVQVQELLPELVEEAEGQTQISCEVLLQQELPIQQELIRQMLFQTAGRQKDITFSHVMAVLDIAKGQSGKRVDLPYDLHATKSFEVLTIGRKTELRGAMEELTVSKEQLEELLHKPDHEEVIRLGNGKTLSLRLVKCLGQLDKIPKKAYTKCFAYDKIKGGFMVRNRKEGDFLVIDQNHHTKKIKQYFIEEKIPADQRHEIVLIAMESQIIWVVGGRISEDFKVGPTDQYMLEMKYNGGY